LTRPLSSIPSSSSSFYKCPTLKGHFTGIYNQDGRIVYGEISHGWNLDVARGVENESEKNVFLPICNFVGLRNYKNKTFLCIVAVPQDKSMPNYKKMDRQFLRYGS